MLFQGNQLLGDTIYPLNTLREKHPELYGRHVVKYASRLTTLNRRFPPLQCRWGDVIFLSAVHPETVCETIARYSTRLVISCSYWKIPVEKLDASKLAIWFYKKERYDSREVVPWDPTLMPVLQQIPQATIRYYRSYQGKRPPYFFAFIPHVLYRGSINVLRYKQQWTNAYLPADYG